METVKQDVRDTLWVGFGRKDAAIIREPARFKEYFIAWMLPHKFKIRHIEFWPGFAWGTLRLESPEARTILLEHVLRKPFRPDNETGWVLNKYEKSIPIYRMEDLPAPVVPKSPKKSSSGGATALNKPIDNMKKRASVADNLLTSSSSGGGGGAKDGTKKKSRRSRSSTASPATVNNYDQNGVLDLDNLPAPQAPANKSSPKKVYKSVASGHSFDEDEDDSELRVKASIVEVIVGVRIVEAVTKKHGVYKLSINDILGASKYKPTELIGAEIVIVLGALKKNQKRRDFLWAEIADNWQGPVEQSKKSEDVPSEEPVLVKEEALENAMINLKRFYLWSIKDKDLAQRQIFDLQEEVDRARSMQAKVDVISHHLTVASQSFSGGINLSIEPDDMSMEELISSTRCSSAFSDAKRVVTNVEYDKETYVYRNSDVVVVKEDLEDKMTMMRELEPIDDCSMSEYEPKNILNLSDSPVAGKMRHQAVDPKKAKTFDLPTSRQTIKNNASSYTVESSAEIQIDMIYWQKMLHWLTVNHFDDARENAKDHAKWVVIVWELAGVTPTNLKSEIIGHDQTVPNFCARLSEMLEAKKSKIPFWDNLNISNIILATLCYLLSKEYPAESVPRCMSHLFSTVPYANAKTGSVYQMRGYVDKYISDEKGLIMSPKGYVLFNSYSVVDHKKDSVADDVDVPLTVPIGTHVLFNASKVEEAVEDGKKVKFYVASNIWIEPDYLIYYNDLGKKTGVLKTGPMAKVLHRANSNLSDEAILSMYEDGLSKVSKHAGKVELKDLLVEKANMETLKPLVDFLRTRLELRLEMASNISLMYSSIWARIGYDLDYLRDDFHTLDAIGSRGCVTYNWEQLLLNFKLPNCLEMGHLVRETLAFFTTTAAKCSSIDLTDGKSLYEVAIKRTRINRHHQLLTGRYEEGSLWVPQPFERTRLIEATLRPKSSYPEDDHLINSALTNGDANGGKGGQEVRVYPEGEPALTFETNDEGGLDCDLVDAVIKGTIAFKYRIQDNVWRIVSKNGDSFPRPHDGWGDREYIPIRKQATPPSQTNDCVNENLLLTFPLF